MGLVVDSSVPNGWTSPCGRKAEIWRWTLDYNNTKHHTFDHHHQQQDAVRSTRSDIYFVLMMTELWGTDVCQLLLLCFIINSVIVWIVTAQRYAVILCTRVLIVNSSIALPYNGRWPVQPARTRTTKFNNGSSAVTINIWKSICYNFTYYEYHATRGTFVLWYVIPGSRWITRTWLHLYHASCLSLSICCLSYLICWYRPAGTIFNIYQVLVYMLFECQLFLLQRSVVVGHRTVVSTHGLHRSVCTRWLCEFYKRAWTQTTRQQREKTYHISYVLHNTNIADNEKDTAVLLIVLGTNTPGRY